MNEILNNAFYLGIGIAIGLISGWTLSSMRYAKQARDALTRNERGWYRHTFSLVLVLSLTVTAAVWTGVVNTQQRHSRICTEKAFSALLVTLNDRTSLSTDLSIADSDQNKAFLEFITTLLHRPQPPESVMRTMFVSYQTKLQTYLELQDAQRKSQKANPFPKDTNYKNCLEGE